MLQRTFIFLDGIGPKKEEQIWEQGIKTWEEFRAVKKVPGISPKRKSYYNYQLEKAKHALHNQNHHYFSTILPQKEMWRLYTLFKDNCCFLDTEVDSRGLIIVLTMFDRFETKTLIRNVHLDKNTLERELQKYTMLITYNGSAFDIPKIERQFNTKIQIPHIDLKPLCQRLGLNGGLKEIEQQLGIQRPPHLHGHPAHAWKAFWASGDTEYLDLIVQYNQEDTVNLFQLMEKCMKILREKYSL